MILKKRIFTELQVVWHYVPYNNLLPVHEVQLESELAVQAKQSEWHASHVLLEVFLKVPFGQPLKLF